MHWFHFVRLKIMAWRRTGRTDRAVPSTGHHSDSACCRLQFLCWWCFCKKFQDFSSSITHNHMEGMIQTKKECMWCNIQENMGLWVYLHKVMLTFVATIRHNNIRSGTLRRPPQVSIWEHEDINLTEILKQMEASKVHKYNLEAEASLVINILQEGAYMSFADIFVNPIANACCLPSAMIAWQL